MSFKSNLWLGIVALGLVSTAGYILTGLSHDSVTKPGQIFQPDNKQVIQLGQQLYQENCASCHGVNLEGQTQDWRTPESDGKLPAPPHDETGHTWHHSDELLFNLTKFGLAKAAGLDNYQSNMPIYEDILSDNEIIAVLSFIKSTWPERIRRQHDQINANIAK